MASNVGIRELEGHLNAVLARVREGESFTVTEEDLPIALLVPAPHTTGDEMLRALVAAGRLSWSGGKPRGSADPPTTEGSSVSGAVVEDRR